MRNTLKNTFAVLEPQEKKQFLFLLVLDIIISIIDILSLALLLWIIQFYIQPEASSHLPFLPGWLADKNSMSFIALFFILFGLKNLAGFLITRAQYRFNAKVAIRISRNNLVNYQQAEFADFVNTDSSIHIRKICFQPFEFCQYILSGTQQIITQLFLITITIIAIILFNAKLFLLLLLILLPPVIIVFYFIKKRQDAARSNIRANNEISFRHLLDALKGYVESNIYERTDFFLDRFIHYRRQFSHHLFNSIILQSLPGRVIEVFAILGLFILIAIAKWSGNSDTSTLITIGAFMAAAYKIIPGIVKLINSSGQIKAYESSLDDLVITTKKEKTRSETASPADIRSIQFKNVSFQFPKQVVLKDFHLSLKSGDFAGISGESGKGKTTVLNLLLGFLAPATGEILINDLPSGQQELKNCWPRISYVRQQSFLIHDTLLRNITLEEDVKNRDKLQYALEISGLDEMAASSPEGLDKEITENGKNISGGQQQRIAIARALYKNADLILLDEPFNELDETAMTAMLEHFRELAAKGKIVIMVTHDQKSLSYCNKIISLDEQ